MRREKGVLCTGEGVLLDNDLIVDTSIELDVRGSLEKKQRKADAQRKAWILMERKLVWPTGFPQHICTGQCLERS